MYVLSMLFIVLVFIVVLILDNYIECSRNSVRYTCFVCAIHAIQLSVQ